MIQLGEIAESGSSQVSTRELKWTKGYDKINKIEETVNRHRYSRYSFRKIV